jgi:phosphatidylserine synthase
MITLIRMLSFVRFVLGATALVRALEGADLVLVARLITAAAILTLVSDWLTRRMVEAPGRALSQFDTIADYVTFVVAPLVLLRVVLISRRSILEEILLDLPLLTAALREARRARSQYGEPFVVGLSPVFFAFVGVTMIFLNLPVTLTDRRLTEILVSATAAVSILMIAPVRYPGPPQSTWAIAFIVAILAAMTVGETQLLAAAVALLGCVYIVAAPFFARRLSRQPDAAREPGAY